jgi:transcription initiation factor IIF auxiliary subunit
MFFKTTLIWNNMEQQAEVLKKIKVEKGMFYKQLSQEDIKYWKLNIEADNYVAQSVTLILGTMLG